VLFLSFVRFSRQRSTSRSWEAVQYDSYQATGCQEQTVSPTAPLRICFSTTWLPPQSPRSPTYATCVHSFTSPFFMLPPSSLPIIQSTLTTKTSGFLIARIGNLLVHMSDVWKESYPHLWSTQINRNGDTWSFNDKGSGTASLRVYSECRCALPMEKVLTELPFLRKLHIVRRCE